MLADYYLSYAGLEAIKFQVNGNFGKELTKCFQKVIDFKNTIEINDVSGYDQQRDFRSKKIREYVEKTMIPEMIKIFKKHAGIVVEKVNTNFSNRPSFLFAVASVFGSNDLAYIADEQGTGSAREIRDHGITDKERKEVAEAAKLLDLSAGKMTGTTFGSNRDIYARIYFDPFVFLYNDYLPNVAEDFTAEEIAAIMLHECGHVIGCAERLSAFYAWRSRIDQFEINIKNVKTIKEAKQVTRNALDLARDTLNVALQNKNHSVREANNRKQLFEHYAKMIRNLSTAIDAIPDEDTQTFDKPNPLLTVLQFSLQILVTVYTLILAIPKSIFRWILTYSFSEPIARMFYDKLYEGNVRSTGEKTSDYTSTMMNSRWNERCADEFVVRQGFGVPLSTGLQKSSKFMLAAKGSLGMESVDNPVLRESTIFCAMCSAVGTILNRISPWEWTVDFDYESDHNRDLRILQDTRAIFKNSDLPGTIADEWISRMVELEKVLDRSKHLRDQQPFKFLTTVFQRFLVPAGIIELVKDGNLHRDYELLQDKLDEMSRNALFYQATRLRRMYS